jgi:hypothetical protein
MIRYAALRATSAPAAAATSDRGSRRLSAAFVALGPPVEFRLGTARPRRWPVGASEGMVVGVNMAPPAGAAPADAEQCILQRQGGAPNRRTDQPARWRSAAQGLAAVLVASVVPLGHPSGSIER